MHFLYLVVALAILLSPSPIWASDIAPLTLESDFLLYSPDYNIILAEENINLKYKDITFVASQLQIDLGKGRITAQGNVQLKGEDETLKGDALYYDLGENKGSIFIIGENIQEIPFAEEKGGFLKLDKGEGRIDEAISEFDIPSATKSFLYITAKKMKIYPKVEIRAWKVTLWNRRTPFLTLPYLPWKTGNTKLPNTFSLKQLSFNSAKGLLIEGEYNYVLSKALSGRILSSYNSKDKLSTIVRGNYSLGRGSLIYLLLRFPSNDEIKYHLIYKQRLSINFGSELTFIYWPQREDPWQGKYELSLKSPPLKSSLTVSRGESYDYERREDWKTKLKLDLDRRRIGETKWSYSISSSLSLEKGKLDPLSFWEEDMSLKLDRDPISLTDKLSLTPSLELTREWYSYLPQQDKLEGSLKLLYEADPKWSYELGYNNILRSRSIFSSPDSSQHIIEGKIKYNLPPVGDDVKRWETSLSLDYDLTGGMRGEVL